MQAVAIWYCYIQRLSEVVLCTPLQVVHTTSHGGTVFAVLRHVW